MASLNDSHVMLMVSWAGEGSDVIVALARDSILTLDYSSNLYLSHDYGTTFKKQPLFLANGSQATIYRFFLSPVFNTHVSSVPFL